MHWIGWRSLNAKSVVSGHGAVGDGSIVTTQRELLVALRDELAAAPVQWPFGRACPEGDKAPSV